jgi:hypothetical protein
MQQQQREMEEAAALQRYYQEQHWNQQHTTSCGTECNQWKFPYTHRGIIEG